MKFQVSSFRFQGFQVSRGNFQIINYTLKRQSQRVICSRYDLKDCILLSPYYPLTEQWVDEDEAVSSLFYLCLSIQDSVR